MHCSVFVLYFYENGNLKLQYNYWKLKIDVRMSSRRSLLGPSLESLPLSSDPMRELFEACKTGDTARVKKLVTPQTVNARDTAGRKSTPLHFAAGNDINLILIKNFRKAMIW